MIQLCICTFTNKNYRCPIEGRNTPLIIGMIRGEYSSNIDIINYEKHVVVSRAEGLEFLIKCTILRHPCF